MSKLGTSQNGSARLMWVKQCHLHHPSVITILLGGMFTTPKWVVYDIVLPTLFEKGTNPFADPDFGLHPVD